MHAASYPWTLSEALLKNTHVNSDPELQDVVRRRAPTDWIVLIVGIILVLALIAGAIWVATL